MLAFDSKGLLIPRTVIMSSVTEMNQYFVDGIPTPTRVENYKKYIAYSNDLKRALDNKPIRQWINGSFVTQLKNPRDIDVVNFIDHNIAEELKEKLDNFGVKGAWDIYGVDGYIQEVYPEDHPKYFFYQSDLAYWVDKFGRTRRDAEGKIHLKGFLEIIY